LGPDHGDRLSVKEKRGEKEKVKGKNRRWEGERVGRWGKR